MTIVKGSFIMIGQFEACYGIKILVGVLGVYLVVGNSPALSAEGYIGSTSRDQCPNVSGIYRLYGEALSGMPLDFKIGGTGLPLDYMLGLDLNLPERHPANAIRIIHSDTKQLSINIVGSTVSRVMQLQETDKVSCKDYVLIIERRVDTTGEATTGQALIIHQLELVEERALIVRTEIRGQGRFLFFFYLDHPIERYGAQFQVVQ